MVIKMANDDPVQPKDPEPNQQNVKNFSPSQIAELRDAAAETKAQLKGEMQHVGDERSGQLSPPHTPGRGR
jgi:hypothetical protein